MEGIQQKQPGHDFSGKDVYPFCTSGMSGPEGAEDQFRKSCPNARLHQGIRLNKIDEGAVKEWLDRPAG